MKIGLLGGTFNPIHRCHLVIAREVRTRLGLQQIMFIPTGEAPHKPSASLAPAEDRLEMVRLAISGEPGFTVSDIESKRRSKSYSIETVEALRQRLPGQALFFIVGVDAFRELHTWRDATRLLQLCHFVVVSRPGLSFHSLSAMPLLPQINSEVLNALDQGSREMLTVQGQGEYQVAFLRLTPCPVSASDIRRRVRAHEPLSNLLPASVESYIIRRGLYQEETDRTGV
jgi:nicotinate-nucleotide adenylyltransferase